MARFRTKHRAAARIPTASMADIAFLLVDILPQKHHFTLGERSRRGSGGQASWVGRADRELEDRPRGSLPGGRSSDASAQTGQRPQCQLWDGERTDAAMIRPMIMIVEGEPVGFPRRRDSRAAGARREE